MALTFEYEKDLQSGATPFICHEPDSTLYNYYIVDERAMDKSAVAPNGEYDEVLFDNEDRHLTTSAVSGIGVKNFPGIGGIGFYKDLYSDSCFIAAPIHVNETPRGAPVLESVSVEDSMLHIVITPPEDMSYTCYRIVVRQGAFAFEYITYKEECLVDIPTVAGDYVCYCIAHDEPYGTVSERSNEVHLVVTSGTSTWSPDGVQVLAARVAGIELDDRITRLEDELGMKTCYGNICSTQSYEDRTIRLEEELAMEVWYEDVEPTQDLNLRLTKLEDELGMEAWYGSITLI